VYFSAGVYVHVTRESCRDNIAFFVRHFLPEEYLSYTNFLVNMKACPQTGKKYCGCTQTNRLQSQKIESFVSRKGENLS
jgi:hypothetical protein